MTTQPRAPSIEAIWKIRRKALPCLGFHGMEGKPVHGEQRGIQQKQPRGIEPARQAPPGAFHPRNRRPN